MPDYLLDNPFVAMLRADRAIGKDGTEEEKLFLFKSNETLATLALAWEVRHRNALPSKPHSKA